MKFYPRSFALAAVVALAACSQNAAPPLDATTWEPGTGSVSGYVVNRQAGTDVANTTVTVLGTDISTTTDDSGLYRLFVPVGDHTLIFTQEGYATSRVEGLRVQERAETKYDTIQAEIFDPFLPVTPPSLTISVENGDTVTPGGEAGTFSFTVSGEVAHPDVNGFYNFGTASFGRSRGINDFLNAPNPGTDFPLSADGGETTVELSPAGFEGETSLHVTAYDINLNRTEVIRYVTVTREPYTSNLGEVADLSAFAVTFGDVGIGTTPLSTNTATHAFDPQILSRALRESDLETLRRQSQAFKEGTAGLRPQQSSLDEAFTFVDLTFTYKGEVLPVAFKIYRKLETQGKFWLIGQTSPEQASLDPENEENTLYGFRDLGAGLEAGVEAEYRIEAVSGDATSVSAVSSVTPLPILEVDALTPENDAVNVSVEPDYELSVENRDSLLYFGVVVLDRVHAESSNLIEWLFLAGDDSGATELTIPHNADGTAVNDELQPYHGYDWQPVAITSNGTVAEDGTVEGENAISVGADFFDVFGVGLGVSDGPVNTFSTGDGSF